MLQRDETHGLLAIGETNLPDGTKMMGHLRSVGSAPYLGQARGAVFSSHFTLGPFTDDGAHLPQSWYEVEIYSYFNGAWQQPPHVLEIVGEDGERLTGGLAIPLDPDVDDSDYAVRTKVECLAPPLYCEDELSSDEMQRSIEILRGSVLTVRGKDPQKSAHCVNDVVGFFIRPKLGMREYEGWRAHLIAPGLVEVSYSYWNGSRPAKARWHVLPRVKQIRYRNSHAKFLSWLAKD